jgi:hypothetical protein
VDRNILLAISLWEAVWKGLALWSAAKHNEKSWFVAILFLNTVGVLPIVFLLFYAKEQYGKRIWHWVVSKTSGKRV